MEFNQLSYFQFDNLVQNRIPFLLVNLGADMKGLYTSIWAMHIENNTLNTTADKAIEEINGKKLPPHHAIVIVDDDGIASARIAKSLDEAGFLNAYSLRGGLNGIKEEKLNS